MNRTGYKLSFEIESNSNPYWENMTVSLIRTAEYDYRADDMNLNLVKDAQPHRLL